VSLVLAQVLEDRQGDAKREIIRMSRKLRECDCATTFRFAVSV
jgi:hypothetical protein